MLQITIKDREANKYYRVTMSKAKAAFYDNGALVSCGLIVPDELPRRAFAQLPKTEIDVTTWKHSGCQSRCTERGDSRCQW